MSADKTKKHTRILFGRGGEDVMEIPNLIDIQVASYERFLQRRPLQRGEGPARQGLEEVFQSTFPIESPNGDMLLEYCGYTLDEQNIKFGELECKQKGITYAIPLKAKINLVFLTTGEIRQKEIYMGDLPIMTDKGTFIVNGAERVVVSQIHRSPGVIFSHEKGIFSSRIIPGNEVAIGRIMNQLSELGVKIVTERQAHVHVSGHPGRPELVQMYKWVRPQIVVPVHGESRHLAEHARLALASGVPETIVQKNGDLIRLAPGAPKKLDEVRVGQLVLDGDVILPADGATVTERRRMGFGGLITVALPVGCDGRLAGSPLVRPFGVPVEDDRDDFIADATDAATRAFGPGDEAKMRENVRLAVRRCATLWTGKKPLVEVMLLQVAAA